MLVDNKFIIIMIPRCATTSFLHTCQINNIITDDIKRYGFTNLYDYEKGGGMHYHESLYTLQEKFGYEHPIISVRRNKYDSFISLWKQLIDMFEKMEKIELSNKLKNVSIDDILFFSKDKYNLLTDESIIEAVKQFLKNIGIEPLPIYVGVLILLYRPVSYYHMHNKNIIWFDFNKLNEMEKWVSDKIGKPFNLVNINSSKNVECNLINNEYFKKKFDEIYSKYEIIKETKTLL